jgi:hypothetical protein
MYSVINQTQADVIPVSLTQVPIQVIGVGAIGSIATYILAKMGFTNITVYDFDKVEPHNVGTQIYTLPQIGMYKVDALQQMIKRDYNIKIKTRNVKCEYIDEAEITILAVDSMEERKKLITETVPFPNWVIETRMGLELARIYTFQPSRMSQLEAYKNTLYTAEEAEPLPCGARSVAYNTYFIGSIVGSQVKKIITQGVGEANNEEPPMEIIADIGKYYFFK